MADSGLTSRSHASVSTQKHAEISQDCNNDFSRRVQWTESLVVATNAVDSADKALLPGTFRTLEIDFGMDPKTLASLVLFENILQVHPWNTIPAFSCATRWLGSLRRVCCLSQSLVTPVWGYFSDRHSRRELLLMSCVAWGLSTALVGAKQPPCPHASGCT